MTLKFAKMATQHWPGSALTPMLVVIIISALGSTVEAQASPSAQDFDSVTFLYPDIETMSIAANKSTMIIFGIRHRKQNVRYDIFYKWNDSRINISPMLEHKLTFGHFDSYRAACSAQNVVNRSDTCHELRLTIHGDPVLNNNNITFVIVEHVNKTSRKLPGSRRVTLSLKREFQTETPPTEIPTKTTDILNETKPEIPGDTELQVHLGGTAGGIAAAFALGLIIGFVPTAILAAVIITKIRRKQPKENLPQNQA